MRSSYIENNYGSVFRALILSQKPKIAVECGVLDGFSLFNIAHAMKFNYSRGTIGLLLAYDLWDEYEYKHGDIKKVEKMLVDQNLEKYVALQKGDAFEVARFFDNGTVGFLHVDISNHGDTLIRTLEVWGDKISSNGMIAFEGGNKDRDNGWIKKYNFKPIREVLFNMINGNEWCFQVLEPFPGLTLLWRK